MSLLKPTPGQIWDRITILKLKIDAHRAVRRGYGPLLEELEELQAAIDEQRINCRMTKPREHEETVKALQRTNEHLWVAENDLRQFMVADDMLEIAVTAKMIAKLNDQRCELIRKIDAEYGMKQSIEEKIYSGH